MKGFTLMIGAFSFSLLLTSTAQVPVSCSIDHQWDGKTNLVLLRWEGLPSHTYDVYATKLLSQPWKLLTPEPLKASTVGGTMFFSERTVASRQFYQVVNPEIPTNMAWLLTNMAWIPAGTFTMGSPETEAARDSDETEHVVTISRGFWMGKYEVTQGEYLSLMNTNPSFFIGVRDYPSPGTDYGIDLSRPVEQVRWVEVVEYCHRLTERERAAGRLPLGYEYRLPTEAQWEYACRAGTATAFHYGDECRSGMANFCGIYEYPPCGGPDPRYCYNPSGVYLARTVSAGNYAPNAWGLYDMHGNSWEWCEDWYGSYPTYEEIDPTGPTAGSYRVCRGGAWWDSGKGCRSAQRNGVNRETSYYYGLSFRVVLALKPGLPTIVQQPQSLTVHVGDTVTFSVTVTNTAALPIGYRWRKNMITRLEDQVLNDYHSSFTITNVQLNHAGNYMVILTNRANVTPGLLSDPAQLIVLEE